MNTQQSRIPSRLLVLSLLGALATGGGFIAAHAAHASGADGAIQAPTTNMSGDVSGLVSTVSPAVVNITVKSGKSTGAGSGFIIDDKNHIVTNAHVVEGAEIVRVKLSDDRELPARVLGKDERLDVAVLEVQGPGAKNLPHVNLGSSASLKVGEPVVAIGNPFGLGGTVTSGIISAKGRAIGAGPYDDFIQTDASINPGNSGGPLFDRGGQVVGMNTAINPNGQGIGFAIPADAIKIVLPQLIEKGHVDRGRLGAHIQEVDAALAKALGLSDTRGALIGDLEHSSPGEKAGLKSGDVVTAVDGTAVQHGHDLPRMIAMHQPGSKVTLEVKRAGATVNVPVTLGTLEEEKHASREQPEEARPASGKLGIQLGDSQNGGAVVERVARDGAAAGSLTAGDVIREIDHQNVSTAADAASKIQKAGSGKPILLRVEHDGSSRWVALERS